VPRLSLAPKEIYRVYGEEEFLACVDLDEANLPDGSPQSPPVQSRRRSRRGQRDTPVMLAALAGACALSYVLLAPARTPWPILHSRGRHGGRAPSRRLAWRAIGRDSIAAVPMGRPDGVAHEHTGIERVATSLAAAAQGGRRRPGRAKRVGGRDEVASAQPPVAAQTLAPPAQTVGPPAPTQASPAAVAASAEFGFER